MSVEPKPRRLEPISPGGSPRRYAARVHAMTTLVAWGQPVECAARLLAEIEHLAEKGLA